MDRGDRRADPVFLNRGNVYGLFLHQSSSDLDLQEIPRSKS